MLLVRDSMTQEVVTVAPRTTAAEALALCRVNRIRHLPVLQGGRLVGVISDRDLRAATAMHEREIGCLPIVDGEELAGIVTQGPA